MAFCSDEDCIIALVLVCLEFWVVAFGLSAKPNLPADPLARQWPERNSCSLWEAELAAGDFLLFSDPLPKPG